VQRVGPDLMDAEVRGAQMKQNTKNHGYRAQQHADRGAGTHECGVSARQHVLQEIGRQSGQGQHDNDQGAGHAQVQEVDDKDLGPQEHKYGDIDVNADTANDDVRVEVGIGARQ